MKSFINKNVLIIIVIGVLLSLTTKYKPLDLPLERITEPNLVYTLTYLDTKIYREDSKKHFYLKGYKLPSTKEISGMEGEEKMEFYYFLMSSFDEESHLESKLFKTPDLITPEIISISAEGKEFVVSVSFQSENGSKEQGVFRITKY